MTAIYSDELTVDLSPDDPTLTEAGILVVDEDPAFQLGLKTFLKEYVGFEKVFTARNGKEAIDLVEREESIELLTVDFQMPGMDGIELLEHLRDHSPRPLGITMITGFPSEKLKKEFAGLKSSKILTNHFLAKPVEFEKLEPLILNSYEELKRSQMLTETMTGGEDILADIPGPDLNAMAIAASNRELMAKFDHLEEKIEQNARAMRDFSRTNFIASFIGDIVKLLVAAAIAWFAWQSGVLSKISDKINPEAPVARAVPVAPAAPVTFTNTVKLKEAPPLENESKIISREDIVPKNEPLNEPLPSLPAGPAVPVPEEATIKNFPKPL